MEIAARFRPARQTSGDFYDLFPLAGGALADGDPEAPAGPLVPVRIAVGDMAGKSIGAALVMALARTALRAVAQPAGQMLASRPAGGEFRTDLPSPAATMRVVGGLLHRDVGRKDFVVCALAVVEPPGGGANGHSVPRLRLANAAQVPPLLCRAGRAVEVEPPGERLPLGVLPDGQYGELVIDLQPGDVVVFASDGLTDAPARVTGTERGAHGEKRQAEVATGELFGFERLAESAALWACRAADAEGVAAGLWSDLSAWAGEAPSHDDMTLVVLRVPHVAPR
ncbi:MAG: serine/threonine-protein phosphatase [Chloroflexi bacterium]|nr:serine/threonine-protein phosphatase [Chloroflexota bacterium]